MIYFGIAISAAEIRKLLQRAVREVLRLRLESMQSRVSFRNPVTNENIVLSGVGSSAQSPISSSFEEGAVN